MSRHLLFNKPYNVLSSFDDPAGEGRETLADYLPTTAVFPAGRLDRNSEGLLFLTDDGKLAHKVTHPRYKLSKTYLALVEGRPDEQTLEGLRSGVVIPGGYRTKPARFELLEEAPTLWERHPPPQKNDPEAPTAWLRVTLREGKKRQIRRMTAAVGHPTLRLIRVAIGPLSLGELGPGEWRELADAEIADLHAALKTK